MKSEIYISVAIPQILAKIIFEPVDEEENSISIY